MFPITPMLVIAAIQVLKLLIEGMDISEKVGKGQKKPVEPRS